MRLEDALLYVIIETAPRSGLGLFCEAAVAGGADVIHLGPALADAAAEVRGVCRRADALLVISENAAAARDAGADGVHIGDADSPVGQYRAALGGKGLVGVSTRSLDDAMLALAMGVDYLLHWAGTGCAAAFSALPSAAGNVLFAAGLRTLDDARMVVESGVYRLCIESDLLENGDTAENTAAFSRVLGRCI